MYSIISDPLIMMLLAGVIGLTVGYFTSQVTVKSQIADAKEVERNELEKEKLQLSEDLSDQLLKVRSGLIETISAYRDAVRIVSEKLPVPTKFRELCETTSSPQLELGFTRTDAPAEELIRTDVLEPIHEEIPPLLN